MKKPLKHLGPWIVIYLIAIIQLSACNAVSDYLQSWPTPVACTPTPHHTPMAGMAYIAPVAPPGEECVLWSRYRPPMTAKTAVLSGTQVEILESVWYYEQNRHGEDLCYMYRVRVPNTKTEGWLAQADITQEKGKSIAIDYWCEHLWWQPTPTPSHQPLDGPVYVNVGEGYGIAGSFVQDPRDHIQSIFAHSLQVDILTSFWVHYDATDVYPEINCYMYAIIIPGLLTKTWLPEDVLTKELADTPNRGCFPAQTNTAIYPISPTPPEGFKVYTPEPEP